MSIDWESQFNPRRAVPDSERYAAASKPKSDRAYQTFKDIEEHRYGDTPLANLDLRRASQSGRPLFVFVHGGYWRGRDKRDFGYIFEAMQPSDVNVVILNYDLCPQVTVQDISDQIKNAMLWLHKNASMIGFDSTRVYVAGHSAGAHLTAMVLAREPAQFALPEGLIRKAYLLSGIYELSPVLKISVNDEIRLTAEEVEPLSPIQFDPARQTEYEVLVGDAEPEGWQAQSIAFADHLRRHGVKVQFEALPQRNHYTILQDIETPTSLLAVRFNNDIKGNSA